MHREHPRFMNLWPNRHIDLGFAKVHLMDAKQNLAVTKQKYEESLAEMEKDKKELKEKADKLREFTITFNNVLILFIMDLRLKTIILKYIYFVYL